MDKLRVYSGECEASGGADLRPDEHERRRSHFSARLENKWMPRGLNRSFLKEWFETSQGCLTVFRQLLNKRDIVIICLICNFIKHKVE